MLTALGRLFFRSPVGDFHCGLRGFSKDAFRRMDVRTTGMEFASEMVIKSTLQGMRIVELPIVLKKDGRSRPPHLRSWRDGWRHLRFMLLFSPLWLFLLPGLLMLLAGTAAGAWLIGGDRRVGGVELGVHSLLACSFLVVLGYQTVIFGVFTKAFAIAHGLHPDPRPPGGWRRLLNLELGLVVGTLVVLAGAAALLLAIEEWRASSFGALDPRVTMRRMIPAVTLLTTGVQTIFSSFFLSILALAKTRRD